MQLASFTLLTLTLLTATGAGAQVTLRAAPSGRGTAEVSLMAPRGSADSAVRVIRVDYGQPHLRGRALHTDSLVPYDRPWRTGANAPTTFRTDVALTVGGVDVPAGRYYVFTLPSRAGWQLILQTTAGHDGGTYEARHDVATIRLRHRPLASPLESLTMWLIPSRDTAGPQRGEFRIAWGAAEVATDWVVK